MKRVKLVLLVTGFSILFSLTGVLAQDGSEQWIAQLRPGLGGGRQGALFYTDYLAPLGGDQESLIFLDLKAMASNAGANEQSLGLGYRRLLNEQWILGTNLFYDTRYSENGFYHQQLGCGLEALSPWIDLRANYYQPTSREKHLEGEDSYAFGERSLLKYENYEEALEGFDAEIGFLVPKISDLVETRIYGGGYWYNSKLGEDVEGIKAGVKIRPSPALTLDIGIRNDNLLGNDTFVKGYVTIPFGGGEARPAVGRPVRQLRERMTDVVVRDTDIMTSVNTKEEKLHDMIYVDNSNVADPDEDGSLSHPHNTLNEAFDDSLYGEGVWIYVQEGDGTATGYTGQYTLVDEVTLWGEGYEYLGLGGGGYPIIDGGGTGDVITLGRSNTVMGCQIQNHGSGVDGGIYGNNPGTVNIIHNSISSDHLDGDAYGIYLESNSSTNNITISDNSIEAIGIGYGLKAYGIYLENSGSSTNEIDISGNTMTQISTGPWYLSYPYGIYIRNSDGSVNTINIARNTMKGTIFGDYGYGIAVEGQDSSINTISISGNALSDFITESANGIWVIGRDNSTNMATIWENTIGTFSNKVGMNGIGVSGRDNSTNTFTISGNTISDFWNMTAGCGIFVETGREEGAVDESENTIIVSGNTITDFDCGNMYGIAAYIDEGSKDYITVSGNIIALASEHETGTYTGIHIERFGGDIEIEVDVGGGSLGSEGNNSIYDNKTADIEHNLGETVKAENNWWGSADPTPVFIGDVDYIPYLTFDPND